MPVLVADPQPEVRLALGAGQGGDHERAAHQGFRGGVLVEIVLALFPDVVDEALELGVVVAELEGFQPGQVDHVGGVEGVVRMLGAGDARMVLLAVVHQAQVEHSGAVELQGRAEHQSALLGRGQVVVAAGVEAEGEGVVLDQAGAQRLVEHA
ncbi:hypothetical protein D3C76_1367450 [compost metagenome]